MFVFGVVYCNMAYMLDKVEENNIAENPVSEERMEEVRNSLLENKELIDSVPKDKEENYPSEKEPYMKINPEALRTISGLLPNDYESEELAEIREVLNRIVNEKGDLENAASACLVAVEYLGQ